MAQTSRLPEGWDEERVEKIIAYYDNQTEEEEEAEIEEALRNHSVVFVPLPLVPAVEAIIAEYEAAKAAARQAS